MTFAEASHPLLVIIGPSGSGKSTAVQELVRRGLVEVTPSWTTRPPRRGETATSVEHRFVADDLFDKQQAREVFLEVVQPFGLVHRYGLPRVRQPAEGRIPLIMLRAPFVPLLSRHYQVFTVYQIEDVLERVEERLRGREQDGEAQGSRLEDYHRERQAGQSLSQRTFVNESTVEALADELERAIHQDFGL